MEEHPEFRPKRQLKEIRSESEYEREGRLQGLRRRNVEEIWRDLEGFGGDLEEIWRRD